MGIGRIRLGQFVTTFGPGAVVDLRDTSVIVKGLKESDWHSARQIREPRLQRALEAFDITHFRIPPDRLDVVLFPRWHVCPKCRALVEIASNQIVVHGNARVEVRCRCGNRRMHPARFVAVCQNGHLSDFPWVQYVHEKKEPCEGASLELHEHGRSGGIADVQVVCRTCKARRSLADAFEKQDLGRCDGPRPWLGDSEDCGARLRPSLRGASNIWFPVIRSAVSIPPWNSEVHEIVAKYWKNFQNIRSYSDLEEFLGRLRGALGIPAIEEMKEDLGRFGTTEIYAAIERLRGAGPADLRRDEWLKLSGLGKREEEGDFCAETAEVPASLRGWLAKVVAVERLREVRALTGFTRVDPPGDEETGFGGGVEAPLSREKLDWLPAVENRGEGIFLALREDAVAAWEQRPEVRERLHAFEQAHAAWSCNWTGKTLPFPGMRKVLLHTLSHLLINRMAVECGYSSTSIRERIYAGEGMAGILLYTASADSDGSLGGLVELARTERLEELVRGAIEDAGVCSQDPLCAFQKPEESDVVNGAACHACVLVPETSCELGNRLLDRATVAETMGESRLGFFADRQHG